VGGSEATSFRSGDSSGSSVKREPGVEQRGNDQANFDRAIKIEESLLIEDVKTDEKPVYIKLKQEQKDTGNEYRQNDADDRLADMLEAKVLNEVFNSEESKHNYF
jgi:hypothetical protein